MGLTPSPLRGTPPIAPFHFATEGELAATLGTTKGKLAVTLERIGESWADALFFSPTSHLYRTIS